MRLLLAIAAIALGGCALSPDRTALMNPVRIDTSADSSYYQAQLAGVTAQQASLPITIASYVEEGIALNEAYCRDWLRKIDDTQRQFDTQRQNGNVLASLGTAIMGLAGATPALVGGYGAAMTAANGLADNFSTSSFLAPTSANVSARVIDLMESYAAQLRTDAPNLTFPRARARLGIHGDLCSFSSIRNLVNGAVTATAATVTVTGTVTTTATPAAMANVVASSYLQDNYGDRLVTWWMPNGTIDAAHDAALQRWMTANGVNVSVPFLAHSKLYEAARAKAVGDLGIP